MLSVVLSQFSSVPQVFVAASFQSTGEAEETVGFRWNIPEHGGKTRLGSDRTFFVNSEEWIAVKLLGGCEGSPSLCDWCLPSPNSEQKCSWATLLVLADSGSSCVQGEWSGGASVSLSVKWDVLGGTKMTPGESRA